MINVSFLKKIKNKKNEEKKYIVFLILTYMSFYSLNSTFFFFSFFFYSRRPDQLPRTLTNSKGTRKPLLVTYTGIIAKFFLR